MRWTGGLGAAFFRDESLTSWHLSFWSCRFAFPSVSSRLRVTRVSGNTLSFFSQRASASFPSSSFRCEPNAPAHHERPNRDFSGLAESQHGRDAVARRVRVGFAARMFPHFLFPLVLFLSCRPLLYAFVPSLETLALFLPLRPSLGALAPLGRGEV